MNKKLKKGFTLAELLIVVAIIAVLTAIAVPLFVTSLNKATDATKEANRRAVRVAATYEILMAEAPEDAPSAAGDISEDGIFTGVGTDEKTWELQGPWDIVATLSKSGSINTIAIYVHQEGKTVAGYTANGYTENADGTITVCVQIDKTALTAGSAS